MPFPILFAALLLAAVNATSPLEAPHVTFPQVIGQNLNGKAFNLPKDFQGPASFVFVAEARGYRAAFAIRPRGP